MNDYKKKLTALNLKSKPIFDIEDHLKYTKDWRGQYIGDAIAILKPHDKYEVSKILKFANDNEISIVPQGGAGNEVAVLNQIKLVNPDQQNLRKEEDGLIHTRDGQVLDADPNVQLVIGFIEGSNVNAVEEMTHIMNLARRFEMNVKMMDSIRDNADSSARILQRTS